MINKTIFLLFLTKFSFLSLAYFVLKKIYPESLVEFSINRYLYKELRSNHLRRYLSPLRLLRANLFNGDLSRLVTKLDDNNLSYVDWPKLQSNRRIYLVGDSHVEFYGRCSPAMTNDKGFKEFPLMKI